MTAHLYIGDVAHGIRLPADVSATLVGYSRSEYQYPGTDPLVCRGATVAQEFVDHARTGAMYSWSATIDKMQTRIPPALQNVVVQASKDRYVYGTIRRQHVIE